MATELLAGVSAAAAPHAARLWDLAAPLVIQIESALVYASVHYGGLRWGPSTYDEFWFRRPIVHVVEFFAYVLFCMALHAASRSYYTLATCTRAIRRGSRPAKGEVDPIRDSAMDQFLGIVYVACWIFQLILKLLRPSPLIQMWWMIMPCHLFTALWAYVFLSSKRSEHARNMAVYLATLMTAFHWGPVSAAIYPDWGDHQYALEGHFFMLHHALLVATPFYYAARYELLPMSVQFFLHATTVATWVNVVPYTLLSYVTGLNVNYMLYPPPNMLKGPVSFIFDTPAYRAWVIGCLILLTLFLRSTIGLTGSVLRLVCRTLARPFTRGPANAAAATKKTA